MTDGDPIADPIEEGHRVVETAENEGLTVRLIGGTAIYDHAESVRDGPFERDYRDVDFVATREDKKDIIELMEELGYEANKRFNTMHRHQLEFHDPANDRKADYIIDRFRFCHEWSLRDRLEIDHPTVPIEDLLLSKLQIIEASDRDVRDMIAMLNDHPLGDPDDPETIDPGYIAERCRGDWGLYKTTSITIDRIRTYLDDNDLPIDESMIEGRLDTLEAEIDEAPKTLRWKLRSLIGERRQWYRRPELT